MDLRLFCTSKLILLLLLQQCQKFGKDPAVLRIYQPFSNFHLSLVILLQDCLLHLEYSFPPKTSLFSLFPVPLTYFRSHLIPLFSQGAGGSLHILGSTWETWENYSKAVKWDSWNFFGTFFFFFQSKQDLWEVVWSQQRTGMAQLVGSVGIKFQ